MRNLSVSVWKSKGSNDAEEKSNCLWRRYVLRKCWHFVSFDTNLCLIWLYPLRSVCWSRVFLFFSIYFIIYILHLKTKVFLLSISPESLLVRRRIFLGKLSACKRTLGIPQYLSGPYDWRDLWFPDERPLTFRFSFSTR